MSDHSNSNPEFYIGNIPVYGKLILSPMDGFSDSPFRKITRRFGSSISYSEFINAMEVLQDSENMVFQLPFTEEERPFAYQIYDDDPERILKAALRLQERRPDFIDINMGCSARRVSHRGAGSGLMLQPEKVARIFGTLSKALSIPLTGKIRLGWDEENKNYRQIAKIIEDNGGSLIAVHGRTREQQYGGTADWNAITEVKQLVSIPVIGNGDVKNVEEIDTLVKQTNCDGVMIGRGSLGNPWIFARRPRSSIPKEEVLDVMSAHLHLNVAHYGLEQGMLLFRKHTVYYLEPYQISRDQRLDLFNQETPASFIAILKNLLLFNNS